MKSYTIHLVGGLDFIMRANIFQETISQGGPYYEFFVTIDKTSQLIASIPRKNVAKVELRD